MALWKKNISFILVDPKEAGNIGASARAIKNMGFSRLELVRPSKYPSLEATVFAHGAEDVLEAAPVHKGLKEAIADKSLIVGTSRRKGRKRGLAFPLKEGIRRILAAAQKNRVAILFGTEDKGLSNKEVDECGFLMGIPSDPQMPSINLAQAVMLVAYEAGARPPRKGVMNPPAGKKTQPFINKDEMDFLFTRIKHSLELLGYHGDTEASLMRSLKHLVGRAGLTEWELKLLHGVCSSVGKKAGSDKA
ncbi:MAG: TrmJ/YjtD family RNA methyltransferase [Thermodesulfovibrionales bacterium]|nr:TrmJ/YjtD family RNA methyltransferase [Thermodesulfovibrionales bacterium]